MRRFAHVPVTSVLLSRRWTASEPPSQGDAPASGVPASGLAAVELASSAVTTDASGPATDGFPITGAEALAAAAGAGPSAVSRREAGAVGAHRPPPPQEPKPGLRYKVKKKAPWGHRQLRDMWSVDAMSRHDKDSVGRRLDNEYRYHPENSYRKHFRVLGGIAIVACPLGMAMTHYAVYGYPFWEGDPQFFLDMIRFHDTSPRSHLYFFHDPEVKKLGVPVPLQEQQRLLEAERKQFTAMANLGGFGTNRSS